MPVQDWEPGSHVKLTCSKLRILDCNCSLLANEGTEAIQPELATGSVTSNCRGGALTNTSATNQYLCLRTSF